MTSRKIAVGMYSVGPIQLKKKCDGELVADTKSRLATVAATKPNFALAQGRRYPQPCASRNTRAHNPGAKKLTATPHSHSSNPSPERIDER
jgi:hypothetical protein